MSPASDRHTSIRSIRYNVLNLPYRVIYEGLVLYQSESRTIYDATGHCHAQLTGYTSYGRFSGDVKLYAGDYIVINDTIDRLITPYGYLRDGVFHSYVHDYQGNIMCVVTEDEVLQTDLYYPDGLPMSISTQPEANSFKYTGKELSLFRGHPVYDFTARHTLPALGNIFRTQDKYAEEFNWLSSYSFCGGDPVNFIDPTGNRIVAFDGDMEWEFRQVDGEYGFYNADNERYGGDNEFLQQLIDGLTKIQSCDIGKTVIDKLIETSETLTFELSSNDKNGTYNDTFSNSTGQIVKRSSTIEWAPNNTHGGVSKDSNGSLTTDRPAYIGLAHEIGHAYDHMILKGKWGSQKWFSTETQTKDKSEIVAGSFENVIRNATKIPPRLYYGNKPGEGDYTTDPLINNVEFLFMVKFFFK